MSGKTPRTADFHIRMTPEERQNFDVLAKECGLSCSELIRLLAQLPSNEIYGENIHLVKVDAKAMRRIHLEMRRFGTNFNQAVHALNSINFYLRNGNLRYEFLDIAIPDIKQRLATVEQNQKKLTETVASLETAIFAR